VAGVAAPGRQGRRGKGTAARRQGRRGTCVASGLRHGGPAIRRWRRGTASGRRRWAARRATARRHRASGIRPGMAGRRPHRRLLAGRRVRVAACGIPRLAWVARAGRELGCPGIRPAGRLPVGVLSRGTHGASVHLRHGGSLPFRLTRAGLSWGSRVEDARRCHQDRRPAAGRAAGVPACGTCPRRRCPRRPHRSLVADHARVGHRGMRGAIWQRQRDHRQPLAARDQRGEPADAGHLRTRLKPQTAAGTA
jgi:hypothetical protein